jgi:hypothetical protein
MGSMNITKMLADLHAEREQIEEAIMVRRTPCTWLAETPRTPACLDDRH